MTRAFSNFADRIMDMADGRLTQIKAADPGRAQILAAS